MDSYKFNRLLRHLIKDPYAIEELYSYYYPRIVFLIGKKYGETLAEDVAQEFFLQLIKTGEKQDYIEFPTSWVYKCAENIAKRKLSDDTKYSYSNYSHLSAEVAAARNEDPIGKLFAKEILDTLSDREYQIIYLFYWDGYNQREIANMLNLTPSNVRQIHSRAIKKIRKYI